MPSSPLPCPPAVLRFRHRADLAAALAAWLIDALRRGAGSFVTLAVGESTLPLYADLPAADPTWDGKSILPLDELVPRPAQGAFSSRLRESLPPGLRRLMLEIEVSPDPDVRARELEATLASRGMCAAVLGLGPDGHVAFNQPGSGLSSTSRVVELAPENRARIGNLAPRALTTGIATIMRAHSIALVASGNGKAVALRRVIEGPAGADVPASWLRLHQSLTVFADEGP